MIARISTLRIQVHSVKIDPPPTLAFGSLGDELLGDTALDGQGQEQRMDQSIPVLQDRSRKKTLVRRTVASFGVRSARVARRPNSSARRSAAG
ncbi:hypothetical protein GCM10020220_115490 [Nonomuraea rubra]